MQRSELIAALEAATGPDRELDAAIFAAVYPDEVPCPIVESGYGWRYDKGHWWLATGEDSRTPPKCVIPARCTASIDAALTLADSETDPLDLLEEALASAREERDGVFFLPLHIVIAALRAGGEG